MSGEKSKPIFVGGGAGITGADAICNMHAVTPGLSVAGNMHAVTPGLSVLGVVAGTVGAIAEFLSSASQNVSVTDDDAQNIAAIIRAGKENNVEEFEIELNKEIVQGLDLKGLETSQNVNVTLGQKGKSSYKLKIKYKK